MLNKEEKGLNQLIEVINKSMVNFNTTSALQQKKEHEDALLLLKIKYMKNEIDTESMYFIGRFQITERLKNKIEILPKDWMSLSAMGHSKPRDEIVARMIKVDIAQKIGVSKVAIQQSRNDSMVKVFIKGSKIYEYIVKNMKEEGSLYITNQEGMVLEGLFETIKKVMICFDNPTSALQNIEQMRGLESIQSKYQAQEIQDTDVFFIGRYRVTNANKDTLAEDIAREIGVSKVEISTSRNPSMVKVHIHGDVIQQYILDNRQQELKC